MGELVDMTVDSILEALPISFFHHRLLVICGLSFMADSMEVALLSFISSCAGDEFNLSDSSRATLVGVVFAGEVAGSMFWGPLADRYGRKLSFLLACLLITLCGFLSAFSPSYIYLLILRALVGFGIGGGAVPFDLLAEFLPSSHRGTYLMSIEYAWTIGSLFVVGTAWILLSTYNWRIITLITAIPVTIASMTCIYYLPESPRWLLMKGRYTEAEAILHMVIQSCGVYFAPFRLILNNDINSSNSYCSSSNVDINPTENNIMTSTTSRNIDSHAHPIKKHAILLTSNNNNSSSNNNITNTLLSDNTIYQKQQQYMDNKNKNNNQYYHTQDCIDDDDDVTYIKTHDNGSHTIYPPLISIVTPIIEKPSYPITTTTTTTTHHPTSASSSSSVPSSSMTIPIHTCISTHQNNTDSNHIAQSSYQPLDSNKNTIENTEVSCYDFFKSRHIRNISIPLWLVWFIFGFTYYGIILYINRLYTTTTTTTTSTNTTTNTTTNGNENNSGNTSNQCQFNYSSIFYNAIAEVVGVFICCQIIDKWGRITTQLFFFIFGGIFVLLMGIKLHSIALLIVGILARMAIMGASSATWVSTPELYPTEFRATGHSICVCFSRLGGFFVPYIIFSKLNNMTISMILGILNLIAAYAISCLPETAGMSLDEGAKFDTNNTHIHTTYQPTTTTTHSPMYASPTCPPSVSSNIHVPTCTRKLHAGGGYHIIQHTTHEDDEYLSGPISPCNSPTIHVHTS